MSPLQAILEKARRALLRRGVLMQDTDDIFQEAFLRVEEYERKQQVRSREALLVTAAAQTGTTIPAATGVLTAPNTSSPKP